jgi:IclR family transcriptional regulator, KDG regulon repressor
MYNAPILRRALDIIWLIVQEQRHLGITEIAQKLSMNKSTAFGILRALEEQGFIVRDRSKKYSMGAQLFELSRMVFRKTDIATVAKPFLERLADVVEETVFMGVRFEDRLKIIQVVEGRKDLEISSPIGASLPITAGAAGKAWLSAMKDDEVRDLLKRKSLRRFTDKSYTSMELYLEAIEKTRQTGYATDLEEFVKGINAIGTVIRLGSKPVAALWVAGFTSSLNQQKMTKIGRHLLLAARLIGERVESQGESDHVENLERMGEGLEDTKIDTP